MAKSYDLGLFLQMAGDIGGRIAAAQRANKPLGVISEMMVHRDAVVNRITTMQDPGTSGVGRALVFGELVRLHRAFVLRDMAQSLEELSSASDELSVYDVSEKLVAVIEILSAELESAVSDGN